MGNTFNGEYVYLL